MTFAMFALGVAVSCAVLWLSYAARRRRLAQFDEAGRALGLEFAALGPNNQRFAYFPCFDRGSRRRGGATLDGRIEVDGRSHRLLLGDFRYTRRAGVGARQPWQRQRQKEFRFSYALLETPWPDMPSFRIRPEGVLDKLVGVAGFADIDFESEAFSRAFHVSGCDRRFVYDFVTAGLMDRLLREKRPWDLQCDHGVFLVHGSGVWSVGRLMEAAVFLRSIVRGIPQHLVVDLDGTSPLTSAALEVAGEAGEASAPPRPLEVLRSALPGPLA